VIITKNIPTGIEGLDQMLGGGLPLGRCILVCGGPGSGKTTFGIQFIVNGALKYDEKGLYLSLAEKPAHLREDMAGFGWDLDKLEREGKILLVDASPIRTIPGEVKLGEYTIAKRNFSMLSLIEIVKTRIEDFHAKRIVIDPITSLIFQYPEVPERRNAVLDLLEALVDTGTTSLIMTEIRTMELEREIQAEEFLSHGVIILHTFVQHGEIARGIQIEKMRGICHDTQVRPYQLSQNGIEVFPKDYVFPTDTS
jgi:KaiC/GvpD/RAD55 family RecA-like ATPase